MKEVFLRRLDKKDKKDIFEWRNEEVTRRMSFNTAPVGIKEHEAWFNKALNDKERVFYIAEHDDGQKIGIVSFDKIDDSNYKVNVTLNPAFRGRGLGAMVIKEGCSKLLAKKRPSRIIARIKEENIASIKAFGRAGFEKLSEKDTVIEMCFKTACPTP